MNRFFMIVLGIILCSLGLTFCILYMNLLMFGYTLLEFFKYILSKVECWFLIVGVILIYISKYFK